MTYRNTQSNYVVLALLVIALVTVGLTMATADEVGSGLVVAWIALAIVTLVVAVFSRLTVLVGKGQVLAEFGPGRPRRRIRLADVVTVEAVRNRWYQGLGLRKVSGGWMYNVWGLDAVELRMSDDSVFRIGTSEPEKLLAALQTEMDALAR